jgi:hypothetical protein
MHEHADHKGKYQLKKRAVQTVRFFVFQFSSLPFPSPKKQVLLGKNENINIVTPFSNKLSPALFTSFTF